MIGIAQENGYKHYIWNSQFYQSCDEILWCQYDEYLFEHKQMGPRHTHVVHVIHTIIHSVVQFINSFHQRSTPFKSPSPEDLRNISHRRIVNFK